MKELSPYNRLNQEETEEVKKNILMDKNLLKSRNLNGSTFLHIAVMHGNFELAKFLINNGIDVNNQDKKGNTALHYCAEYHQYEIAKYILQHNGQLNISDKYGNEPLWVAAINVRKDLTGLDIVELFLKNGADKNHKNNVNKTPWDVAHEPPFDPLIELMKNW